MDSQTVTQKIELVQRFHSRLKFPTMSVSIASSFLPSTNVLAIKILPSATTGVRRPFHLALTIDTSGSMEGPRIQAVKRTLHLLIDAMADDDVLSLISYSHESQIDANATVLSAATRPVLHEIVNRLEADGGTNMESAFVALDTLSKEPAIDSVFLLTDGQINQGISATSGLQRILGSILVPGTPVNTLGFGADHNIRLLRDMAMRSRGSYTYADADEMLPAIIGDIMGGLATETGRNGILTIPAGWRCLELGCEVGDTQYVVGTLIAEKEQWIVLEGPEGAATSGSPIFQFQWSDADTHVEIHTTGDTIPAIVVAEQRDRVHVAAVFSRVTDMFENSQTAEAKTALTELGNYLDSSTAKARPFVIRLHAQVDEMLDMISSYPVLPPLLHGFGGGIALGPPLFAPALSRMASNTAALGVQRGFFTNGAGAIEGSYSSPTQTHNRRVISTGYTQLAEHDI